MNEVEQEYRHWLERIMAQGFTPHQWQEQPALERECLDRLTRIPTGFGKTFGVAAESQVIS